MESSRAEQSRSPPQSASSAAQQWSSGQQLDEVRVGVAPSAATHLRARMTTHRDTHSHTKRHTHTDSRTLKATAGVLVVIQGICSALEHARVRHITQQDTVQERARERDRIRGRGRGARGCLTAATWHATYSLIKLN